MKIDELKKNIEDWVKARDPDCHVPFYKLDERFHRFGKDFRFWVIGTETFSNNEGNYIVTVGDWVTRERQTFSSFSKDAPKNPIYFKLQKKQKQLEEKTYSHFISKLKECYSHPYLTRKNVKPHGDLKVYGDDLIIPGYSLSSNRIVGFERINEKKTIKKQWAKGAVKKNVFFPIGNLKEMIFVCEGYATASTIHEVTGEQCLVTFGKSGLFDVATHFSKLNKTTPIIVACDYDMSLRGRREKTEREKEDSLKKGLDPNTGIDTPSPIEQLKDKFISNGFINIYIIFPKYMFDKPNSDFNDLYREDSDECEHQLKNIDELENFIVPITFLDDEPCVWSRKTGLFFLDQKASKEKVLRIASKDYWKRFGVRKGEPNWTAVSESIISACASENIDYFSIKNPGIYLDKNELIINTGKEVIGNKTNINDIYLPLHKNSKKKPIPNPKDHSLHIEELHLFLDKLFQLSWKRKKDALLVMAWICIAPFYRTLEFVPHLILNSESSSGKSWMLYNIFYRLLNPFYPTIIMQGTTLAGFLRKVKKENLGICLLEERENKNSQENEDWLNVFRISSTSYSEPPYIDKAAPGGGVKVITYPIKIITALFGITSIVAKDQDLKRFLRIGISSVNAKKDIYDILLDLQKMNIERLGADLFSHMYKNYKAFTDEYKFLYKKIINDRLTTGHTARKIAYLISAMKICLPVSSDEIEEIIKNMIEDDLLTDKFSSMDEILDRLLFADIHSRNSGGLDTVIHSLITQEKTFDRNYLRDMGVFVKRVRGSEGKNNGFCLYITNRSTFMNDRVFKIFNDPNNLKENWRQILKNNNNVKMKRLRLNSRLVNCFEIELEKLNIEEQKISAIKEVYLKDNSSQY